MTPITDVSPPPLKRRGGAQAPPVAAVDARDAEIANHAAAVVHSYEDAPRRAANSQLRTGVVWDGHPTEFTLARPLMRDLRLLAEGEKVRFRVNPHPEIRGLFVGDGGPDDESEHVIDLYKLGYFTRTTPQRVRNSKQGATDDERAVNDALPDGEDGFQPALESLAETDYERTKRELRASQALGSPEALKRAEQQMARTDADAARSAMNTLADAVAAKVKEAS